MKLFKLEQKGIAHYILPLLIAVAVAVGGVWYYLDSHADAPNTNPTKPCIDITLTPGTASSQSTGPCVSAAQWIINGINPFFTQFKNDTPHAQVLVVNGQYGQSGQPMAEQVIRWQRISKVKVDSQIGPTTWGKLCDWTRGMSSQWSNKYPSTSPPGYMVNAINAANNVKCSPKIPMPIPVSIAPTNVADQALSSTSVKISWAAPSSNIASSIASYRLYLDGNPYVTFSGTSTSFTVIQLSPDTAFDFSISAISTGGNISPRANALPYPVTTPSK